MCLSNFGAGGNIFTKLFQTTCREAGVIICVQFLEGLPPKIWEGQKIVRILARFLTTFDFDREYLRNGSTYRTSEKNLINHNPFHVGRKKFGELWSTNKTVLEVHTEPPKWTFFGRLHFGHYGVLPAQIFTHARD